MLGRTVPLAAALVFTLVNLPLAAAFHGGPYKAEGTAHGFASLATSLVLPPEGEDYAATLWWSVYEPGHFTFEAVDAEGTIVASAHFPGEEDFFNERFSEDGCVETADYRAWDTVGPDWPLSELPKDSILVDQLQFAIEGYQRRNLCTLEVSMHYEGTFERFDPVTVRHERFELVLDVWAVGDPVNG